MHSCGGNKGGGAGGAGGNGFGEGGVLVGVQLVTLGDFDVAQVGDGVSQRSQGRAKTGVAHRPRADVDPTQRLAKIEGNANDMNITWRNRHLCRIPEGGGPTRLGFR